MGWPKARNGRPPLWLGMAVTATLCNGLALAQPAPFSAATTPSIPAGWRVVGLPPRAASDSVALTRFDTVMMEGVPVLRVRTEASYGNLVWDLPRSQAAGRATLSWRWRLDTPLERADLRVKEGDDSPLKVCVLFDLPLQRIPFIERSLLQLARAVSGEPLPAATVCYVWDRNLRADTTLANAHSKRVRYLVLQGPDAPLGQWRSEQRLIAADFVRLFGEESPTAPPVLAIGIGADSDNTRGRSVSFVGDVRLAP